MANEVLSVEGSNSGSAAKEMERLYVLYLQLRSRAEAIAARAHTRSGSPDPELNELCLSVDQTTKLVQSYPDRLIQLTLIHDGLQVLDRLEECAVRYSRGEGDDADSVCREVRKKIRSGFSELAGDLTAKAA